MLLMDNILAEYYDMFRGLPNNRPIVRNNTLEDAFTIYTFDKMYSKLLNISIDPKEIEKISSYIVAPPDGGIDIFIEREDGDEYYYDIFQIKYSLLAQQDIIQCMSSMKRTIKDYLKNPKLVPINLREVISKTNFDANFLKNCTYYVVHKGDLNYAQGLKTNEVIVTANDLHLLSLERDLDSVPIEILKSDGFNNFLAYSNNIQNEEEAYICNINGYDLAKLNNKYFSTELGRNILFGQNLRDSLSTRSKTAGMMVDTINKEPEKFWFYNNGITIIAETFNAEENQDGSGRKDSFKLERFSIINGAQTTSALGDYLKNAEMNKDDEALNKLKKVFVLARILVINKPELKDNISIYNNTQNPITSRDMVSNRIEQKNLHQNLIDGESPNIFVEIRRGSIPPTHVKLYKHQYTTNEVLAQLAFAAFYSTPFTAKDKKRTLFNNDFSNNTVTINEDYHKLFHYDLDNRDLNGTLHKKSKHEIDELLFVTLLYKEGKKYLKTYYEELISKQYDLLEKANEEKKKNIETMIANLKIQQSINNVCMFYCITLFYEFKSQFETNENGVYNYVEFYKTKSTYRKELIEAFSQLFLTETISLIKELSATNANIGNWIRMKKSQDQFLLKLQDKLTAPAYENR